MCKVIVYSSPECAPCRMLKKTLEQNYIEFTDINVKTLSKEQLQELGITSVPVTTVGELKYLGATPAIITEIIYQAGNTL